ELDLAARRRRPRFVGRQRLERLEGRQSGRREEIICHFGALPYALCERTRTTMKPNTRNALLLALGAAVSGYLFFKADSFWGLVTSALILVWALIYALPVMDGGWRFRVGFATCTLLCAAV